MTTVVLSLVCGGIGLLVINDCNNKRKNSKIIKKLKKEIKRLELNILKKIRNIKDVELKNIMINAEVDEYKYKTKCYCRLFEMNVDSHDGPIVYQIKGIWNDWNIGKYNFKNNLKMKLMDKEWYDKLHEQKLKRISELFENATDEMKVSIFKHYEEYIVYGKYLYNKKLLEKRNEDLRIRQLEYMRVGGSIHVNYIDELDEPEEAGSPPRRPRKVLGLFY